MRTIFLSSILIGSLLITGCQKILDPLVSSNETVSFYLSDSKGAKKSMFAKREDIYFHLNIKNNRLSDLKYTMAHGGPSIADFLIFKKGKLVGSTDDGYCFPAIVVPGKIKSGATLKFSISWYSNPEHKTTLDAGDYSVHVTPYIKFDDFNINDYLKSITFFIKE